MIKDLVIGAEGRVSFTFELTTPACPVKDRFQTLAQKLVADIPGVTAVDLKMTANVRSAFNRPQPNQVIPGVKQAIAVASGKGGVGKSTVAINLACALGLTGAKVGLLDADIYGPSIPGMMGVQDQPKVRDQKLVPLEAFGVKLMSIGFLAGADKAMVWRGPLVSRALEQMLPHGPPGGARHLVLGPPPWTGDASLTLAQAVPLTRLAVLCTPQTSPPHLAPKAPPLFRRPNR